MDELPESVIVIVPARNEELAIGQVISEIQLSTRHLVVVDDGSVDATRSVTKTLGATVIVTEGGSGYGAALRTGFKYALEHAYSVLVTLDADGAHNARQLQALYSAHARSKCCLTIGDRFANDALLWVPSSKRWANRFAAHVVNRILGTSLRDVACGYRVIDASLASRVIARKTSDGFGFVCDVLSAAVIANCGLGSAPADVRYDASEILCTSQPELMEVVEALINHLAPTSDLFVLLTRFISVIQKLRPVTIILPDVVLCALPVVEAKGYLFQAQNPDLAGRTISDTFDFR